MLRDEDRETLLSWTRSSTVTAGAAQRARIVLLAAEGLSNTEIATRAGVSRPTVIAWRARYEQSGIDGLVDRPRSGRPRRLDHGDIVSATLTPPPSKLAVPQWSSRTLANHLGISFAAVAKAWRDYGIQPRGAETFRFATEPELVANVTNIAGLHLDPSYNAVVLCVDARGRAADPTRPTLLAALESATSLGHRNRGLLEFLERVAHAYPEQQLHLVADSYTGHKQRSVRNWLTANPRVHVHSTPTSASWLKLVEVCLGLAERRTSCCDTVGNIHKIAAVITRFIADENDFDYPFAWINLSYKTHGK